MTELKPIVAIVGRPNVGKSTLFNRLVGSRRAITMSEPGTTRDRIYGDAEWQGSPFTLVDTGGLTTAAGDRMTAAVNQQVREAMTEADLVILAVDVQTGLTPADKEVAQAVRRVGKPVIVVANKADNVKSASQADAFWELGFGAPQPVSALHGRGTGDLSDAIVSRAETSKTVTQSDAPRVAIVGRPNVGKSTLVNKLAGNEHRITGDQPGTTRDLGSVPLPTPQGELQLLDTAGLAKRKRMRTGIPRFSLLRTLRAINQADVVVLLIDAVEGPTVQDAHIASYVLEAGRAVVVAVNKWDQVETQHDIQERFHGMLTEQLGWLPSPPVVFLSALTGAKVDRLLRAIWDSYEAAGRRVPTAKLNKFAERNDTRPSTSRKGKAPKMYYLTQVSTRPPTFVVFVNDPAAWTPPARRWLANALRKEFELFGTALQMRFRRRTREAVKP